MEIINTEKEIKNKRNYKPEIDGLRALAVLVVIIYHFNKSLIPNGFLGVDIFFVISGYVITASLSDKKKINFGEFIVSFYVRRIKRLVPALLFFVLINSFLISMLNPAPGYSLWAGVYSLFGLSNIEFYNQSVNYFADNVQLNIFTHTWSLGVEEQFYLLFPFIFWISNFGQKNLLGSKKLFFLNFILSIISLISFIYFYQIDQPAAYFLMPNRFWEISVGCIVFILISKRILFFEFLKNIPPSIPLLFIILLFFLPVSFALPSTILLVILTAILIFSIKKGTLIYSIFTNKKVIFIGLISYSLYLWHWGIITLSRYTVGIYWWTIPFQVLLIFLISFFSYRFIEIPFRNFDTSDRKWKTIIIGLFSSLFSSLLIMAIGSRIRNYIYLGKFKTTEFDSIGEIYDFKTDFDINNKRGENDIKAIYIFGDSHGYNLYPSLKKITSKFNYKIFYYIEDDDGDFYRPKVNSNPPRNKDLIFFSARAYYKTEKRLRSNIEYLVNLSNKENVKLVLVDDVFPFGENYDLDFFPKFSFYGDGPKISRNKALARRNKHTQILMEYIDNKNIFYIDPIDIICNVDTCSAVINNQLIYADGSPHFNEKGAFILNDLFETKLPKIINNK